MGLRRLLPLLALLLALGLTPWLRPAPAPPAEAQGVGIFSRPDCTTISSAVAGQTWCFDSTLKGLKVYDGTKFATLSTVNGYVVNVKDLGAVGDGTTDDTAAIQRAINALPSTGGTVVFPGGNYRLTATVTLANLNSVNLLGVGVDAGTGATTITQAGTAHGFQITGTVDTRFIHVADMSFNGNSTGATALYTSNCKNCVFERLYFQDWTSHPVYITGVSNLHNIVRDSVVNVPTGAASNVRALKIDAGNANRIDNVYFPGTRTGSGQILVDLIGAGAGHTLTGNRYESATIGVAVNSTVASHGEYFNAVTTSYQMQANNQLTVVGARGPTASNVDLTTFGVLRRYLTFLGDTANDLQVLNVQQYGAVGDGIVDDTTAVVNTFAAIPSGGGVVYFPPGTYKVSSATQIATANNINAITIRGAGRDATIIKQTGVGAGFGLSGATDVSFCVIQDLTLDGNSTGSIAIALTTPKDCVLERLRITGWLSHGIHIAGANALHNTVRDTRIIVPAAAAAATKNINVIGGNSLVMHNNYYLNSAATPIAVDMSASSGSGFVAVGDICDTIATCYKTNGEFSSTGGSISGAVTNYVQMTANNMVTVIGIRGISASQIDTTTFGVTRGYLVYVGENTGNAQGTMLVASASLSNNLVVGSATAQSAGTVNAQTGYYANNAQFINASGTLINASVVFANLNLVLTANGMQVYCSDCTAAGALDQTCVGGGSGNLAVRVNGLFKCAY